MEGPAREDSTIPRGHQGKGQTRLGTRYQVVRAANAIEMPEAKKITKFSKRLFHLQLRHDALCLLPPCRVLQVETRCGNP
jgi:hypothetical protein